MSADSGTPPLTYAQREIAWGFESAIAVISNLSRRIDERVVQVNAARAELAERLVRLDAMLQAADDPDLEQFLRAAARAPLPEGDEHFPARLYGS